MEDRENCGSAIVEKTLEDPASNEISTIKIQNKDSIDEKPENLSENIAETIVGESHNEVKENFENQEKPEISETHSTSGETEKTPPLSNDPRESPDASEESKSQEKSPESPKSKLKDEIDEKSSEYGKSAEIRESPISNEVTEVAETAADDFPKIPVSLNEPEKSDNAVRSTVDVTSGCVALPPDGDTAERPVRTIEENEDEDMENGGEDGDNDDDDDDDNDNNDDDNDDDDDGEINDEIVETEEDGRSNIEPPEVGIVGPPTAVRDIVNEEELGTTESSSLPSDNRNNEVPTGNNNRTPDVAEWIERSRRSNDNDNVKDTTKLHVKSTRRRKKSFTDANNAGVAPTRKSQRIITSIIRRSIKCLNKMHAAVEYGSGGTTGKKLETTDKREEDSRSSPKVPQSRQNGAALPEETATAMATTASSLTTSERLCPTVKRENHSDAEIEGQSVQHDAARSRGRSSNETPPPGSRNNPKKTANVSNVGGRTIKSERENTRKRRSTDENFAANCGSQTAKKMCLEQRERLIHSLVGTSERVTAEELASRADELRAEVQALDELARAKELEWNEILSMRKLKEEAYLRIERRRQVVGYMESNGQLAENLPPASLTLIPSEWENSSVGGLSISGNSTRNVTNETGSLRDQKEGVIDVRLMEAAESQRGDEASRDLSPVQTRREKTNPVVKTSNHAQRRGTSPKQLSENGRKQQQRHQQHQQQQQQQQQQQHHQQQHQTSEQQSLDNRQIGEGRQGPIVDVRSIIADYRLRHPETVPRRYEKKDSPARQRETTTTTNTTITTATTTATTTTTATGTTTNIGTGLINVRRGRRMRNSVNIGLGAGGAMVETGNVDSRPSSTDSCKSNTNHAGDPAANSMSFKDVLVQFAKLSQQQGEPVKTPQNYPDVTLHPVAPSPITISSTPQQQTTGSLLHGILTKSQSPRPTTFSPTLARLLTAPERERNSSSANSANSQQQQQQLQQQQQQQQQNSQTQHLLQTYQGSNPVSISDLLSSSKARTEITITPVVTPVGPIHTSQSNSLVHVDDVEEDTSLLDERDSRLGSGGRDNRDERDSPPRCQGCQERAAQFVCAGCGNQWYCSRDCQVAAWDEHSEVCSG